MSLPNRKKKKVLIDFNIFHEILEVSSVIDNDAFDRLKYRHVIIYVDRIPEEIDVFVVINSTNECKPFRRNGIAVEI